MTDKRTLIAPEAKKNKRVELGDEPTINDDQLTRAHRRALQKYESKKQYLYPVEKIAQDTLVVMNVKFPGSDEEYPQPQDALFRFVSHFYPNAKGGPLYVDQPKNEREVYRAYERHKVMAKLKLRHIISEKNSSYEDLLEQLGECK